MAVAALDVAAALGEEGGDGDGCAAEWAHAERVQRGVGEARVDQRDEEPA